MNHRAAFIVGAALFVVAYGTNVSTAMLVTYRERLDLGDSATQAIFVVYVVGILLTLLVAGQLSDRFGRRAIVAPSLVLSALGSALVIAGRNDYGALMGGRVLLGVASGAAIGVAAAWLQELLGPGSELRAALITTFVTYGGFGLGPPVTAIFDHFDAAPLVAPFVVHIAMAMLTLPFLSLATETVGPPSPESSWKLAIDLGIPDAARANFMWVIAPLAVLVFAFPSTGFALFPLLVADEIPGSAVLITAIAGALTPWGGLAARPVVSRVPPERGLVIGAAVGTAGYVLGTIAWLTDIWPLVAPAGFILGLASGILATAGLTLVGQLTDDETRGALSSTFYLIAYCGMTAPLVITAVGSVIGLLPTLLVTIVLAATITVSTPWRRHMATRSTMAGADGTA